MPAYAGGARDTLDAWVRKIPWSRQWQPTTVFLPGESCGQNSLVGQSLEGHKESDTIALISHASKVMLKILQARLQQYMNRELPDVQAGFSQSGRKHIHT